jgi:hypothetical protein
MADTPEAKMKKKVDKVLKEAGVWYFAPQSGIYGRSGVPDRIACVHGRMVGIEVKAAGGKYKVTPLQEKTMADMVKAGAHCVVVDSDEGVADFRTWLKWRLEQC